MEYYERNVSANSYHYISDKKIFPDGMRYDMKLMNENRVQIV